MKKLKSLIVALSVTAFVASALVITGCSTSKVQSKSSGNQLVMDSSIKQGKLDNGMSYFIRENGEPKNRIQLRLVVKAGSCMEEDDQKGLAHFIEHLCFNGTEHFEKSAIVDYFESIGMAFGPEVNAYTSFENTVYMLELPADNPEILKKSLLVLHDWASAVTFDPEEIEKERGVIVEEWRMRNQGVQGRVSDKETALLLKDSRYAERLPIGDMDIIKSIPRDRIIDFYKKWYRPENMAVVAVGDVKSATLEAAIKEVMGSIEASDKKTKVPSFNVPLQNKKTIEIMKDKELTVVEAYVFQQNPDTEPVTTAEQIRKNYALALASDIFNQRCAEKTNKPDALWLGAGIGKFAFTNNNSVYFSQFYPKTGLFNEAFKAFLDEYERFLAFGVTDSELERIKQGYLQSIQQSYTNKDKQPSANYANNLVDHFLTGRILISAEDDFKLSSKLISEITKEEILEASKEAFGNRGTIFFILSPESIEIPAEKEITDIWKNYESEAAKEAYVDDVADSELMKRPAAKAKVITKKAIKDIGGTEYTFENGVKIITKKTDFKKDSIAVYGGSKGGLYQLKEEDVPSAKVAMQYAFVSGFNGKTGTQINKILSSKQMSFNADINSTDECFSGSANKDSIENWLQLVNLVFDKAEFTQDGWQTLIGQYNQIAETYGSQPFQVYSDKITEIIYGNTLYTAPQNKEWVAKLNPEVSERVFRERFSNPADFTFVFVGDFNEKALVDLCASYLGTLKTNDKLEEIKYVYFPFPKKSQTVTVKKGIDQTGYVYMCMGGELREEKNIEQSFKENTIINQLSSLLDIRLREVIREDKSGSYGVSTNAYIDGWPERFYKVNIEFGCEPARAEELQAAVIEAINDIKAGNFSDENIVKVKEGYIRSIETSLRDNNWWLRRINAEYVFTDEPLWYTTNSAKAADWITKEALVEAANKYLNTERVITAYLKPEK